MRSSINSVETLLLLPFCYSPCTIITFLWNFIHSLSIYFTDKWASCRLKKSLVIILINFKKKKVVFVYIFWINNIVVAYWRRFYAGKTFLLQVKVWLNAFLQLAAISCAWCSIFKQFLQNSHLLRACLSFFVFVLFCFRVRW